MKKDDLEGVLLDPLERDEEPELLDEEPEVLLLEPDDLEGVLLDPLEREEEPDDLEGVDLDDDPEERLRDEDDELPRRRLWANDSAAKTNVVIAIRNKVNVLRYIRTPLKSYRWSFP
jgi:hypothetical protein